MARVKLTPTFIKKQLICPSGIRRIEFCDDFPGFYVEVRATSPGQGTYYLRYKNKRGKTCHKKLGRTTELPLTKARNMAKTLKLKILLGADPRAEANRKKQVPTFEKFIHEQYLPYVKVRKRSWDKDVSLLNNRLLPVLGKYPLDEINRTQIISLHRVLRESGLAAATCDRHLVLIKYVFNLAVEWETIECSPAARVKLFKEDNKKERYLNETELARLVHVLQTDNNRAVCLVVLFLLSTGSRRNEALQSKWSDIDMGKRVWRIPAQNSKSKRIRSVPLNDTALSVLKELRKAGDQEYLFISPRTGMRLKSITGVWFRLRIKANLLDFRLHDCRHQYASMLVNSGRSLYEVQQILGHQDPKVTMRYSHLSTKTLQSASDSAASIIGTLTFESVKKNTLYKPSA